MLANLLITAGAAAYLVTGVERFIDLSFLRGVLALGATLGAAALLGYRGWEILPFSMAAAFLALTAVVLVEVATSPDTAVVSLGGRNLRR